MDLKLIESEFKEKVCKEIRLMQEGIDRYRVFTPFQFNDGDSFAIVLKKTGSEWVLTDEGHTFMHLSYDLDIDSLDKGNRAKIISTTLNTFGINERDGHLFVILSGESTGDVFYNYIQALVKITDVSYLSRERVKSTFFEDFKSFISQKLPSDRFEFNYNDAVHDPQGKYPVDCRINKTEKPLFVFAIGSDDKCNISTINLLQFEKWGLRFKSLAIFEDQEEISRKAVARFSDVCEKQFSSLTANAERIEKYIKENIR
ncbi:MAG: DUF1828 domain-containing protein [Bacteroidales bacterium]